ncbi:MAG TPA: carboxypeptidase M32, partial [Myxococcaceae bacterium]|nr:carboxypeptidase M32 [Myxococcaceae bacterium]
MDTPALQQLLGLMQELKDLHGIIGLASWDQETYLPPKAADARAHQLSTLQGLYHERLVSERLGGLLDEAVDDAALSADHRAMARVLRHERDRAVNVPDRLVRELAEAQSRAIAAWRKAREESSFAIFRPFLERLLVLRREQADAIGHGGERYDALLDGYEPGMTVARLTPVLNALKEKLAPMVQKLCRPPVKAPPDVLAGKRFEVERQWRFTMKLLEDIGFDLEAGRQDRSVHPFTGGTHPRDVRLTTRLDVGNPLPALFGTIHEAGHGLYEQGFSEAHFRTPLAASPSMGLHESQSRLWENMVGRSLAFWRHYYPALQAEFPDALG